MQTMDLVEFEREVRIVVQVVAAGEIRERRELADVELVGELEGDAVCLAPHARSRISRGMIPWKY